MIRRRPFRYLHGNGRTPTIEQPRQRAFRQLQCGTQLMGNCFPKVGRSAWPISVVSGQVVGTETTNWTDVATGFAVADGIAELSLRNFGDYYSFYGLRFECTDGHRDAWWTELYGTTPPAEVIGYQYGSLTNYGAFGGGNYLQPWPNAANYNQDQSRTGWSGYAGVPAGSHIVPQVCDSITIPQPFEMGNVDFYNTGGAKTGYDCNNFTYYHTHARPVINGTVAGPLSQLAPTISQTSYDHSGTPYTYSVTGAAFNRPEAFGASYTIPLDAGTTIGPGDVVGFDLWTRVVRTGDSPEIGVGDSPFVYDSGIPLHTRFFPNSLVAFNNNHSVDWPGAYWTPGNAAKNYSPERHTYELDFGGTSLWTPTGAATFKIETAGDWSAVFHDCRCYAIEQSGGVILTAIQLEWQGEIPLLSFHFDYRSGGYSDTLLISDNALEIGYYPRDTTDAAWLGEYWHFAHPSGNASTPGPFNQGGSTVFDFAYTKTPSTGSSPHTEDPIIGVGGSATALLNIAESITVTRVNQ